MRTYYHRLLKRALTRSIGPVDLWMGLAGAALGVADHLWPAGQLMTALAWQVPIWALVSVMALRLLLAPYWLAKEDADKIAELEEKCKLPNHKIKLEEFYVEAGELLKNFPPPQSPDSAMMKYRERCKDVDDFIKRTSAWTLINMGPASQSRLLDLGSEGHEGDAIEWKLKLWRQNLTKLIGFDH
jgi:hypothetical protein